MNYRLTRKDLITCLKRLKDSDYETVIRDEEFIFYHLNRNFFNTLYLKDETERPILNKLTQLDSSTFKDNLGRSWTEMILGSRYHKPVADYTKDLLPYFRSKKEKFCRKFISTDSHMTDLGYAGCEYELIVRHDYRLISGEYMETYNFGSSGVVSTVMGIHRKFDVEPHGKNKGYETKYYPSNKIEIVD